MEIDVPIPTHGEHYSRSRGEQMARAVDCASSEPCYKSGLLDSQTLVSDKAAQTTSQFVAAVLKDEELHLTPLQGILQLRPSLHHFEQADTIQHSYTAAASDGDTTATESEGEEAKPVQVRFACSGGRACGQQHRPSELEQAWVPLVYHTIEVCMDEDIRLCFCIPSLLSSPMDDEQNSLTMGRPTS